MGAPEIEQFLTHLAVQHHVAASTQNQALAALLFLYRDVVQMEVGDLNAVRARRAVRVPTVLSVAEVQQLLAALAELPTTEPYHLMGQLMYGAGLRLMECCRLRVKDVDLSRGQLTVRGGNLPQAYVYPQGLRETRDLLRRRMFLVHKRAELITHVQTTNAQYNLPPFAKKLIYAKNRAELRVAQRFEDASVRKSMEVTERPPNWDPDQGRVRQTRDESIGLASRLGALVPRR